MNYYSWLDLIPLIMSQNCNKEEIMDYRTITRCIMKGTLKNIIKNFTDEDILKVLCYEKDIKTAFEVTCTHLVFLYNDIKKTTIKRVDFAKEVYKLDMKYRELLFKLWDFEGDINKLKEFITEKIGGACDFKHQFDRWKWILGYIPDEKITLKAFSKAS